MDYWFDFDKKNQVLPRTCGTRKSKRARISALYIRNGSAISPFTHDSTNGLQPRTRGSR